MVYNSLEDLWKIVINFIVSIYSSIHKCDMKFPANIYSFFLFIAKIYYFFFLLLENGCLDIIQMNN